MKVVEVPWLKHNERKKKLSGIILHHDAGNSALSTIDWLRKPFVNASYHFVIERDGTIYKTVPSMKRAWHAGRSKGKYGRDSNSQTIGICLSNRGDGEKYPNAQLIAAHDLVVKLTEAYGLEWISTHRLITKRKIDPAYFSFRDFMFSVRKTLAEDGLSLGMWMDESLRRGWDG